MSIKPDLQVSVATAQAIVDCAILGCTVADVSSIHGGEIAAIYEITFAGAQPPLVLKVYPDSLHWKMQKEAALLSMVQGRLSVPVPRLLLSDDSKRLLDLNFILMTRLDGAILGRLEESLTSDQFISAYNQIGHLLRELHRIPMHAFGYIGAKGIVTPHATNRGYLSFQFDRKLEEFRDRDGDASLAARIAGYAADHTYLLDACTSPVLCHNDLHAGNLLADTAVGAVRLTGVLDFEGALAGDPLMDVAKALYYLSEDAKRAVLEGYGDMGRRHWSETLDLYHLYFVLELWCWMAQIENRGPLDQLASDLERYSTV